VSRWPVVGSPLIRLVLLLYLDKQGFNVNVEDNHELCKVLLSHRRAADCGVPSRSEHGLGTGKMLKVAKIQGGKFCN